MKRFWATIFLLLIAPCLRAQGDSEVTLYLGDGTVSEAVLLHVSDSVIIADLSLQSWARTTVPPLDDVRHLGISELDSIAQLGKNRTVLGAAVGFLTGWLPGMLIGGGIGTFIDAQRGKTGKNEEAVYAGLVAGIVGGMIAGAVIGGMLGAANSYPSEVYYPAVDESRTALRRWAVYPTDCPRFLHRK